jgi:hypothetical protein
MWQSAILLKVSSVGAKVELTGGGGGGKVGLISQVIVNYSTSLLSDKLVSKVVSLQEIYSKLPVNY